MPDTTPRLRLRSPADLLATLPYLLGYRLADSLVVAAVTRGRLGLIQRFDLPGTGRSGPPRQAVDVARRLLRREDPEAVLIVAYESEPGAGDALRTAMSRLCDRHGWQVLVEVVARGDQWWDLDAGDDLAGPGRDIPSARQVPAVAECVAAGLAPLPSRGALAEVFEPAESSEAIAELVAAERARRSSTRGSSADRYRRDSRAWRAWLAADPPGAPTAEADPGACLARCVVSLDDTDLRDALIAWLAPGVLPPDMVPPRAWGALTEVLGPAPTGDPGRRRRRRGRPARLGRATESTDPADPGEPAEPRDSAGSAEPGGAAAGDRDRGSGDDPVGPRELRERGHNRLIDAIRATPPDDQVALLTVFASIAWWQGDGALAAEAAERARRLRPSYTLAVLLHEMIRQGIRFGTSAGMAG